jgi:hypothetical protein
MGRIPVNAVLVAMLLLIVSMLSGSRAYGQGSPATANTLKGLSGVQVLIEELNDAAKALGLDTAAIQTDVELKLRMAGLRVLSDEEERSTPDRPWLYVNVNVVGKAAAIGVNFNQTARLARTGETASVTTWSRTGLATNPTAESVRNQIKDYVDAFLNDWLSANPKK